MKFMSSRARVLDPIASIALAEPDHARTWIEFARLATLRGIGTDNARALNRLGITSVEALATTDAATLARQLERLEGRSVVEARVRVWIRAARRAAYAD